jgi:hypothetical protein
MIRAGYCYHDGHLRIVLNDPDLDDYVLVVGAQNKKIQNTLTLLTYTTTPSVVA